MSEETAKTLTELTPEWRHVLRIWWSYLWRNLVAILISMVIGVAIGAVMGFILSIMGLPVRLITNIVTVIGFFLGLSVSVFPMKMIIGKKFNGYRLILVEDK